VPSDLPAVPLAAPCGAIGALALECGHLCGVRGADDAPRRQAAGLAAPPPWRLAVPKGKEGEMKDLARAIKSVRAARERALTEATRLQEVVYGLRAKVGRQQCAIRKLEAAQKPNPFDTFAPL